MNVWDLSVLVFDCITFGVAWSPSIRELNDYFNPTLVCDFN